MFTTEVTNLWSLSTISSRCPRSGAKHRVATRTSATVPKGLLRTTRIVAFGKVSASLAQSAIAYVVGTTNVYFVTMGKSWTELSVCSRVPWGWSVIICMGRCALWTIRCLPTARMRPRSVWKAKCQGFPHKYLWKHGLSIHGFTILVPPIWIKKMVFSLFLMG